MHREEQSMQDSVRPSTMWIRPVERPFLNRISDWTSKVTATGNWVLTDFLTPREQHVFAGVADASGLELAVFGGTPFSERQRGLLMPSDWQPEEEDFQISILSVKPLEHAPLSHGSILGSVLGTGLDRKKIGDILIQDGVGYVFCVRDVVRMLQNDLHQIGKTPVSLALQMDGIAWRPPTVEKAVVSVASLRADAILAQSCHWSRSQAQEAITRGRVSLNFIELTKPEMELAVGDILSVRGFGRVQVLSQLGRSKKERERLEIGIHRSQSSSG